MAVATVVHAATPITLPFGDFGLQAGSGSALELPVPPPPPVARPDLAQMRLVIRPQHPPCDKEYTRRQTGDRRQAVIEARTVTAPKPTRLG
jgi:hypothetical protein